MIEQYWSQEYLAQLANDGEADIARKLCPIYARYSLAVTSGTSLYTLESQTREIKQVTWKGHKVWPLGNQEEAILLDQKYRTTQLGRPDYYLIGSDDLFSIRFIPVPNETITKDDSAVFSRTGISTRVIISYYRLPDRTATEFSLPDYFARITVKAYVLSKAFSREGKGQNLKAAVYYENKYSGAIDLFKSVKYKYFSRHEFSIGPSASDNSRGAQKRFARLQPGFTITPP